MKTIIFGASGFVGKALMPLFPEHVGFSSAYMNLAMLDCVPKIEAAVEEGDTIIMAAGVVPNKGNVRDMTIKNVLMARNLLAGLKDRPVGHFIYVSSDAVYPSDGNSDINEYTSVCPDTLYGHMHAMREQYFREFIPPEKLTIIRPCAIYGPQDTHFSYGPNRFVRDAREKGEVTLFGGGEEQRDHIHVDDVAAIIHAVAQQRLAGVFNAVTGRAISFAHIASLVNPTRIIRLPRKVPVTYKAFKAWPKIYHQAPIRPRTIEDGIRHML